MDELAVAKKTLKLVRSRTHFTPSEDLIREIIDVLEHLTKAVEKATSDTK